MYTIQKCIYTVYAIHIYATGPYIHWWYSHALSRMRLSIANTQETCYFKVEILCSICVTFFRNLPLA